MWELAVEKCEPLWLKDCGHEYTDYQPEFWPRIEKFVSELYGGTTDSGD